MSLCVTQNNNVLNITQSTVVQARCQYFNGELAAAYFNSFNSNTKQFPAEIEYEWE